MQLHDCINFQLTKIQKTVFTYFKDSLAKFDVTPSQYALMSLLWNGEELSPSHIAQELDLDASSITGLLNRMESKELIQRVYSDEDRRGVTIKITDKGMALKKGITATIEECNKKVLKGLSAEDDAVLRRCLSVLHENAAELCK